MIYVIVRWLWNVAIVCILSLVLTSVICKGLAIFYFEKVCTYKSLDIWSERMSRSDCENPISERSWLLCSEVSRHFKRKLRWLHCPWKVFAFGEIGVFRGIKLHVSKKSYLGDVSWMTFSFFYITGSLNRMSGPRCRPAFRDFALHKTFKKYSHRSAKSMIF